MRCCSLRCWSTSLIGSGRSLRELWWWVNWWRRFAVSVGTTACFIGTVSTLLRTVAFSLFTYTGAIVARECTRRTPLTLNINIIAIYRYLYACCTFSFLIPINIRTPLIYTIPMFRQIRHCNLNFHHRWLLHLYIGQMYSGTLPEV